METGAQRSRSHPCQTPTDIGSANFRAADRRNALQAADLGRPESEPDSLLCNTTRALVVTFGLHSRSQKKIRENLIHISHLENAAHKTIAQSTFWPSMSSEASQPQNLASFPCKLSWKESFLHGQSYACKSKDSRM